MIIINPIKERILQQLAHYKFLTVSQFVMLGVGHTSKVREGTRQLSELGLTKHAEYATVTRKKGQADRIHFLTRKGVKILMEELGYREEQIRYPRSVNSIFKSDYFHRISTINTRISYEKWARENGFEQSFFDTYFDKVGSQRNQEETGALHSLTQIQFHDGHYVQPDAIFSYVKPDIKQKLWMLEVWNGNNTKNVLDRLEELRTAIQEGIPSEKYGLQVPSRIINTFEYEGNMKAVLHGLSQKNEFSLGGIENYFYFGLAESIWQNFDDSFVNLKGDRVKMSDL